MGCRIGVHGHHLETLKLLFMNEMYEDGVLKILSLKPSTVMLACGT